MTHFLHGSPDKTPKIAKKPWRPYISLEQILAFDPSRPETFTEAPLVNEVLTAMHQICPLSSRAVGQHLCISHTKLSSALELETGMSFSELREKWTQHRLPILKAEHPDWTMDQLASAVGYADQSALWRANHREVRKRDYKNHCESHELFLSMSDEQRARELEEIRHRNEFWKTASLDEIKAKLREEAPTDRHEKK